MEKKTWWVVAFRKVSEPDKLYRVLACKNAYHAGHNGFERRRINKARYRHRKWGFYTAHDARLGYKFASLTDARTTIRSPKIADFVKVNGLFAELLEFEGFLHEKSAPTSVRLRMFVRGTNEMEILALEAAAGGLPPNARWGVIPPKPHRQPREEQGGTA